MNKDARKPNHLLRRQREQRGWTLEHVADELYKLCEPRASKRGDINANMVSRWELGKHPPSLFYQEKLCILYGKSAEELGFVEPLKAPEQLPTILSSHMQHVLPMSLTHHQALDLLSENALTTPEQQLWAWLAVSAHDLAPLFDADWTLDAVLESLQIVLQGVQAMSMISRRKLLQLGAAAVVSGISIPTGKQVSAEERSQLHNALGESIAASWKLFHTAGNAQVLAVGQAQLFLVQQNQSLLYSSVQPLFYSGVYRLIGAALHFQGRYREAQRAHEKAYIAALEGADAWNMAQSRSWQAYGLKACGKYLEALQVADAALRLVSHQMDTESIRLQARLLAFTAENAALLHQGEEVQKRLGASEELLDRLPGFHEEFDRVSWLQQAGTCALSLKQYDVAMTRLQQALDELPAQWTLRSVSTAVPLAITLTRLGEMNEALVIAKSVVPVIKSLQSPTLVEEFHNYLQTELLANFSKDQQCQSFVVDAQRQLAIA